MNTNNDRLTFRTRLFEGTAEGRLAVISLVVIIVVVVVVAAGAFLPSLMF